MDAPGQQFFEFYHSEAFDESGKSEAQSRSPERPIAPTASNPTDPKTTYLMEQVVRKTNLTEALRRVRANKGSPGVDGMTVDKLAPYLREYWPKLKEQLLAGTYKPHPVKRVEIPKPGGGTRLLGVPSVLDRFIQQAILQVLTPITDPDFSEHSYGFRPGKNAHQAVKAAQRYIREGYIWVADIDLEKFLDSQSYCSPVHETLSNNVGFWSITRIRSPLRFPRQRWTA